MKLDANGRDYGQYKHIVVVFNAAHSRTAFTDGRPRPQAETPSAPHGRRRSCARLCHDSGGELEQIQFLLGHVSVQTTERYIGCKQRLRVAVNDRLGIEPG